MLKNKNFKTIGKNTLSLLILQSITLVVPLILLPYLVRTLGIEKYGLIVFAVATISFFRGIVSYGFDLTGTKQISIFRNKKNRIDTIFNSILIVKLILVVFCFLILLSMILTFQKFQEEWIVFALTFLIVFGDALFPIFFFQGIEKMSLITYFRVIHKISFLILVLLLVNNEKDYILVPLFDALGSMIVGFLSLYIVQSKYSITLKKVNITQIKYQFYNSWHVFLSKIMVIFYTSLNIFILGIFTNNTLVGYYSIADKIYQAIRSMINPIIQALFPYLSNLYKKDKNNFYKFVKNFNFLYILTLLMFSFITFYFSNEIIYLISGEYINESSQILKILSISLIFSIGSFYSTLLVIKSKNKTLSKITMYTMILNLTLVVPTIYYFNIIGLAILFLFIQIIQAALQIKHNLEIWRKYT